MKYTNNSEKHTQQFEKWLLFHVADGLQDLVCLTFAACSSLPHNILDAILYKGSKIENVKIQDWLIKLGTRTQNPTQHLLMLLVCDGHSKQGNQCTSDFSTMLIQSPIYCDQRISVL